MTTNSERRPPSGVSIVCVFNNIDVRTECLDQSISRYQGIVDIDYLPIDNRNQQFSTAGAALNHGAARARHGLVVFVHQDVYLHSIDRIVEAGVGLLDGSWTMLGASGMTSAGELVGLLRDRTDLIGRSAPSPVEVDTLDEVLFMIDRDVLLTDPLTEEADLAWHAYAVEYAARLRSSGRSVGAVDLQITHNSLTINLDRLDVAHRVVGSIYPDLRPIHTTCGTISNEHPKFKDLPLVRDHRWRKRWFMDSVVARRISKQSRVRVVLSDIRHDVDLLAFGTALPLHVINIDGSETFVEDPPGWLRLSRLGKPVHFAAVSEEQLDPRLADLPRTANILVTGLGERAVAHLCGGGTSDRAWIVGVQSGDHWALSGPVSDQLPDHWMRPSAVPMGGRGRKAGVGRRGLR